MKATPTTRTSASHPLRIDEVPLGPGQGLVGITICPGKCGDAVRGLAWQRDLGADLDVVARWGARAVLTLIEADEMRLLGVRDLGRRIGERRIAWYHLPIVDVQEPGAEFERLWPRAGRAACELLRDGGKVLVHCRGGLGRAGTVAACLLIELGAGPQDAIRRVRAARHGAIETPEQERYVARYVRRFAD